MSEEVNTEMVEQFLAKAIQIVEESQASPKGGQETARREKIKRVLEDFVNKDELCF